MDTCTKAAEADIDALLYENMILKKQLNFLMECITNQINNLELLFENSKNSLIHKETLKPYYEKSFRCNIYL